MENKDTKYMDLNTTLSAVGKAVFVNFYYDFKNETLSDNEITIKLLKENPGSKSNNQNFRIRRARHIFNEENQLDALKIVINSKKISIETRNKAKKILDEELQRIYTFQEAVEEREFIEKFNENIVYSEQYMFEYNNNPEPLCGKNAKQIVSRDKGNPQYHKANNVSNSEVTHYQIDGKVIKTGDRCNYLLMNETSKTAYLIELKGSDLVKAASQLEATENALRSQLVEYQLQYRIVANKCKTQEIHSSAYRKYQIRWKSRLLQKTGYIEEKI